MLDDIIKHYKNYQLTLTDQSLITGRGATKWVRMGGDNSSFISIK